MCFNAQLTENYSQTSIKHIKTAVHLAILKNTRFLIIYSLFFLIFFVFDYFSFSVFIILSLLLLFTFKPIIHRNEQVRDGLLSLVHSYSQLENKLDRHEQRERALGEIIKRGLQTLQKGQKIFDPMQGSYVRLEERVGQIETLLMGLDEKFNEQSTFNRVIDSMEKYIASQSQSRASSNADKLVEVSNQVEDLSVNVKELRKEVDSLRVKHDSDSKASQDSLSAIGGDVTKKLDENANAIGRIQESLGRFGGARAAGDEDSISKDLQYIKSNIGSRSCGGGDGGSGSIDKDFLVTLSNQTLDAISDMRHEVLTASDKSYVKTATKLKETAAALDGSINELLKNVGEGCDGSESKVTEMHKLEQMLAQMGDNVLSIKRNMEFNVHAITLEVGEAIKANSKEMSSSIGDKFEAINETIWNNHNGAITNLTSKIESEISQVWRQIGIMYQEVSSSKDALNKLQELTTSYVNGTVETMDHMEGKV